MHTCKHIFVETLSCCETFEWTWLEPIYLLRYTVSPWFMTLFWNLEKVRKFIDDCSSCIAPSFHMCWTKSWRVTLYSHPINGLLPSLVVENFSKKTPRVPVIFRDLQRANWPYTQLISEGHQGPGTKSPQKVGYSRDSSQYCVNATGFFGSIHHLTSMCPWPFSQKRRSLLVGSLFFRKLSILLLAKMHNCGLTPLPIQSLSSVTLQR